MKEFEKVSNNMYQFIIDRISMTGQEEDLNIETCLATRCTIVGNLSTIY